MLRNLLTIKRPKNPIDRLTTYIYLDCIGHTTPDCGQVEQLLKTYHPTQKCVLWTCGESRLTTLGHVAKYSPSSYVALFVGQNGSVAVSSRYVQIGAKGYWIDFVNNKDWKSTNGKSEIIDIVDGYHSSVNIPFFSIDFVRSDKVYAIDFDVEPKLYGCGIKLTPKEFKQLYRNAQKYFDSICT